MEHLEERIIDIVTQNTIGGFEVKAGDFLVDLGYDSLKKIELILALENEFEIEFSDDDLQPRKLKSVRDLITIIGGYLSQEVTCS